MGLLEKLEYTLRNAGTVELVSRVRIVSQWHRDAHVFRDAAPSSEVH